MAVRGMLDLHELERQVTKLGVREFPLGGGPVELLRPLDQFVRLVDAPDPLVAQVAREVDVIDRPDVRDVGVDEHDAGLLARIPAPAWTFIHGPRSSLSSTQIRKENGG